ncbi:MAG TPA: hypothetical protein VF763_13945 [Candidatus Limnocylindrales bacterium]
MSEERLTRAGAEEELGAAPDLVPEVDPVRGARPVLDDGTLGPDPTTRPAVDAERERDDATALERGETPESRGPARRPGED